MDSESAAKINIVLAIFGLYCIMQKVTVGKPLLIRLCLLSPEEQKQCPKG